MAPVQAPGRPGPVSVSLTFRALVRVGRGDPIAPHTPFVPGLERRRRALQPPDR